MRIRLARNEDYSAIARLHRQTIRNINSKDYPEDIINVWSARTKAARYRNNADQCKRWVAIENNKVVGFCDHDFTCELGGLYIHKDFQEKGFGKKLLHKAEESMKKSGCKKIKVMSTITAKPFYQKNGYKIVKKSIHNIHHKRLVVFIMTKKISQKNSG